MQKRQLFFLLFLLLTQVVCSQTNHASKDSLFTSEAYCFKAKDGLILNGIITLPEYFDTSTQIAILVSPPQKNERDYGGMFSSLAQALSRQGIATLRFDNRSFSDTTLVSYSETVTMFDHAADVHAAFLSLKSNQRFKNNPVGLVGHSEGGTVATVETSHNKDVSFLATLSSCGIKGADFMYWQTTLPFSYSDSESNSMSVDKRNHIIANTYQTIQFLDKTENDAKLEKKFRKYLSVYFPVAGANEVEMLVRLWLKPRQIAFMKHTPGDYFSKVSCPALIMHGMMDGIADWKTNMDGIEKVFIQNKKTNYRMMPVENLDHSYQYTKVYLPYFASVSHANNWKSRYSEETWNKIAEWVNSLSK